MHPAISRFYPCHRRETVCRRPGTRPLRVFAPSRELAPAPRPSAPVMKSKKGFRAETRRCGGVTRKAPQALHYQRCNRLRVGRGSVRTPPAHHLRVSASPREPTLLAQQSRGRRLRVWRARRDFTRRRGGVTRTAPQALHYQRRNLRRMGRGSVRSPFAHHLRVSASPREQTLLTRQPPAPEPPRFPRRPARASPRSRTPRPESRDRSPTPAPASAATAR